MLSWLLWACAEDPVRGARARLETPAGELRLLVWGDAGTGDKKQRRLGEAAAEVCAERGCDAAVILGDNFYPEGILSPDDPQLQSHFLEPYGPLLELPFFMALGNHDYGSKTLDRERAAQQLEVSLESWRMPGHYYAVESEVADLFVLDTNALYTGALLGWAGDQERWLQEGLEASQAPWKIVLGHHPYRSNGRHGDAGSYEGVPGLGFWIEDFFEDSVCERADLYLSGHEHSRQWLQEQCGVEWIVSGGGSKTTPIIAPERNPVHYQDGESPGFFWMSIGPDTLEGAFYNHQGELDFRRRLERT